MNFELKKKKNDFNLSLGDVPEVGAACQFFISFRGCIEAILPENFFCNRRTLKIIKFRRFNSLLRVPRNAAIFFS